jgi:hypothetical protein
MVAHEDLHYQLHWKVFFLKVDQVQHNMPIIINLAARRVERLRYCYGKPVEKSIVEWIQRVPHHQEEMSPEMNDAVNTLMQCIVLGAGLAFLDSPDGRFGQFAMEEEQREDLRLALQESLDEISAKLYGHGIEVRERKKPAGWLQDSLERDMTVHTIWVEELGLDAYLMAS